MNLKLIAAPKNASSRILAFLSEDEGQEGQWPLCRGVWGGGGRRAHVSTKDVVHLLLEPGRPALRVSFVAGELLQPNHQEPAGEPRWMPLCSPRTELKEKGPWVVEGRTVEQTRGPSLCRSLGALQRPCERSVITEWPLHEITGNAENSVCNQVWFVRKNMSWSSWKHRSSYTDTTPDGWFPIGCVIGKMYNPALFLVKLY